MTDENGEARTTATWNSHATKTNANDAAVSEDGTVNEELLDADAGIWFGTEEPRDSLGALPFDTYTLTELRVGGNVGLELITIPSLTIKRDGYEVDWGTLDDQPSAQATLRTHASDALDADKAMEAERDAIVIDEVHYAGVVPGHEYRVAGHLVERASATVITDKAGAPVGNEAIFVAGAEEGVLDLAFTFDARAHADSDIVVLEELTDLATGEIIAAESNLNDAEQTVHVVTNTVAAPSSAVPEKKQPLVHTAAATPKEETPLVRTGLSLTGDALFPLLCCCVAGILIAAVGVLRARKTMRRRRLRVSLRTGV